MASGTITGTCDNNSYYTLTCEWSSKANASTNKSSVTATVYLKSSSSSVSTYSANWSCTINGTSYSYSGTVSGTKVKLGQKTWTVNHNDTTGKANVKISFSYTNTYQHTTYTTKSGSGSATVTLDTIPRVSSFSLNTTSGTLPCNFTVTINKATSSFTHSVIYTSVNGTNYTKADKTSGTSVTVDCGIGECNAMPNSTSGNGKITVITYNGSTEIGRTSQSVKLYVPSSVKPTVSIGMTGNNNLGGVSVAGKSTITLKATASGSYSSTIKSYSWSKAVSGTSSSVTTGKLGAGTYTAGCTVTDSRGRTAYSEVSFTFYAYSNPWCTISAFRANSSGGSDPNGTYVRLKLNWGITNVNNNNANQRKYSVYYKQSSSSSWTALTINGTKYENVNLSGYAGPANSWDAGGGWATTTAYDVKFKVTDSYGSAEAVTNISTINALLNIETTGVAVGGVHQNSGAKLEVHGSARCIGNGKSLAIGTGANDVYVHNSNSGKYLQLKDNGTLSYSDSPILMGTMTGSGNRWGVWTNIGGDGVMEVGKYLDFHESDGNTADFNMRLSAVGGNLQCSGDIRPNGHSTARFGYSSSEACTFIENGNNNWLRLCDDGTLKWRGYNVVHSNGTHSISGTLKTGSYSNSYQGVTFKRKTDAIGNYLGKIGCSSIGSNDPSTTIEIGTIADTSKDSYADYSRFSFSKNYFLTHSDNVVNIGSSNYHFKAVYASNGTIQTSDARYKYILESINSQKCYDMIKGMNIYGYSTLNKRIDQYVSTTEISDELQLSSNEDMNLHMGFMAQDIASNELGKYLLIKDKLNDEDGNPTDEYIYGIDNYAYTSAVHGALKHEIELRDRQIELLEDRIAKLEEMLNQ